MGNFYIPYGQHDTWYNQLKVKFTFHGGQAKQFWEPQKKWSKSTLI